MKQTSTAKLPPFFQKILKTVRDLRDNETKLTWRKTFTVNLFVLENEKEVQKWQTNTAKLLTYLKKFLKTVCDLRVNKTKVTSRKTFNVIPFVLEIEKSPKLTKPPSLETSPTFLVCLLTYRPQMSRMCCYPDCFSFSNFLDNSSRLYNLKLSSLNSGLIFR